MENFDIYNHKNYKIKIKVLGLGGTGGNAIDVMIDKGIKGVEFIVANTDSQDLKKTTAPTKLQIGNIVTKGLGSGGDPSVGREAALEDQSKIAEALEGSDIVFIVAGMGGGTGTGSSPLIAQISRELGALTVGVVTKPFSFEGPKRNRQALEGMKELEKEADTLIVIPLDGLGAVHTISILDAFQKADETLYQAVRGISEIITGPGYINADFAEVKSMMSENDGKALMGTGFAKGSSRGVEAAEMAITSPLLEDIPIDLAKGILLHVTAPPDFGIEELNDTCNYIKERAHHDVNLIFGLFFDNYSHDDVRITLIATGLNSDSETPPVQSETPSIH